MLKGMLPILELEPLAHFLSFMVTCSDAVTLSARQG
jgi:hypothetical protein